MSANNNQSTTATTAAQEIDSPEALLALLSALKETAGEARASTLTQVAELAAAQKAASEASEAGLKAAGEKAAAIEVDVAKLREQVEAMEKASKEFKKPEVKKSIVIRTIDQCSDLGGLAAFGFALGFGGKMVYDRLKPQDGTEA